MNEDLGKALEEQIRLVRNRIATATSGLFTPNPALLAKDRALLQKLERELESHRSGK